ncbi:MAG: hypothetical protein IKT27_06305 [Clostridia bacterium]|nr:hypothetical protein [Clostridia bacterium]
MTTIIFIALVVLAGWLMFDPSDWGHRKNTGKKINGVDVGAYKRFHDRHQGPK